MVGGKFVAPGLSLVPLALLLLLVVVVVDAVVVVVVVGEEEESDALRWSVENL